MSIVKRVLELGLPTDQLVVIGSGVVDALGLRKSGDLDLVVSEKLFQQLKRTPGWSLEHKHDGEVLSRDDIEVWRSWGRSKGSSFEELFAKSVEIGGVCFGNPEFVMAWKAQRGEPKDLQDIALLQSYLASQAEK